MNDTMDYEAIRYEVEDGRARITLARPEKHNAITPRLLEELEHALWEADDDCAVHSVVLRGEGASFCSGYDLTTLGGTKRQGHRSGRSHDDDIWLIEQSNRRIRALWEMHKPSIAQVHGNCLAGGTDLAMACDIVIAAEDARIGFPAAGGRGAQRKNKTFDKK
jgi:enoyl-CoA hydratase